MWQELLPRRSDGRRRTIDASHPLWSSLAACVSLLGGGVIALALTNPEDVPVKAGGRSFTLDIPGWVLAIAGTAIVILGVAVLSTLIPAPRRKDPEDIGDEPPARPKGAVLIVWIFLLVAIGIISAIALSLRTIDWHDVPRLNDLSRPFRSMAAGNPSSTSGSAAHSIGLDLGGMFALFAIAAAAVGAAFVIFAAAEPWAVVAAWMERRPVPRTPRSQDMIDVVTQALRTLEEAGDPRGAVIACYRRCEESLAAQVRRRRLSETPREFVADAFTSLSLPTDAVRTLLSMFERARFSELPITGDHQAQASNALSEIRSALEQKTADGSAS